LLHYPFVEAKSSLVAAASVFLARLNLGIRDHNGRIWSAALEYYSRHNATDLEETVLELHQLQYNAETLPSKLLLLSAKARNVDLCLTKLFSVLKTLNLLLNPGIM